MGILARGVLATNQLRRQTSYFCSRRVQFTQPKAQAAPPMPALSLERFLADPSPIVPSPRGGVAFTTGNVEMWPPPNCEAQWFTGSLVRWHETLQELRYRPT
eukprot:Skav201070  [mRNA]  locus=scaffold963:14724:18710:+ [translate_table: standard]